MEVLGEISNFCRFCLSQDCELLIPLSRAIENHSISIQDIQQTTGISILESEISYLTVCTKCSKRIELVVDFRRCCKNGNILFMQIFGHIIDKLRSSDIAEENLEHAEYRKDDPLKMELILQNELNNENTLKAHDEPAFPMEESQEFDERTSNGQEDCEDKHCCPADLPSVHTNTLRLIRKTSNTEMSVVATNPKQAKSKERFEDSEEDKANDPNKTSRSDRCRKRLCGICGVLVYNLVDHTRSHTKENLLKCPHCPVQMANATNLLRHVNTAHVKKIIKSCEPCDKGFTSINAYNAHMQFHHKGKQYQCEICLKMFNHASSRRDHIKRIHFVEWKYECHICQRKFKDKGSLRGHATVHSTNAPFACSHCPKRFKSSTAKKTHEITHSGIDFPCTLCTKVYRYKSLLSMHYRKCHPEECKGLPA
ncbi:zinc finger protein 32-like isoform X9 [Anopheles darlingi]|uniref:zinc finger protein 32-like isoform X7 n=1 Tax=Anopheles darlingi TaxID=43151 RepID=UPI0020FFF800|nr:zinc finger protein 32-like isoform X7 [Anopheles darlingi]XP_049542220.1 zinc finger protein 32-like isoform X8 [Anopheles darlingi]XP_049542221.1 zinc finger protein 32-like isoform X9 [Anopheles darlingi]